MIILMMIILIIVNLRADLLMNSLFKGFVVHDGANLKIIIIIILIE